MAGTGPTFQPQSGATVQGTVELGANAIEVGAAAPAALFAGLPVSPTLASQLDWAPAASSPIATGGLNAFTGSMATKAGAFVTPTAYRGAADPAGPKWWQGWTNYADN